MASSEATSPDWVVVKTTLPTVPLPSNADRSTLTTERLIIRPLNQDDLEPLYVLATQEPVMRWTALGRVDADRTETQARLDRFTPPNDTITHNCAICLRESGDLIGIGGVHKFTGDHGWPEMGYMLRQEHWGKGLATEFVRAFLRAWDALPRSEVELKVSRKAAGENVKEGDVVEERLVAITAGTNAKSQKILDKCGLERFLEYVEDDLADPTSKIDLVAFRHFPGRTSK
ncbi:hypothetical protein NKR23_g11479 [Pleurostoma richardsiae]|uniref:N-acetyltransferase domain-containing protein n=1 Tax=Pleurostoma richardsiae TaxID=41990 RepID=A0AA38R3G2_9PEZI|nr:hypothetical protein NKR23_g11479 [Pleurostoma richardsiae]